MKKQLRTILASTATAFALSASLLAPGIIDQAHAVNYPRSAYGTNPNAGKTPNADNGWGSAKWPNCPTASQLGWAVSATGDRAQVRSELVPLVTELMNRTEAMGYTITSSGAFSCRAIVGAPTVASNHSRGRAIDINPSANPQSWTFTSNLPPAVVSMWESHGFYWGGRYNGTTTKFDAMHFEYYDTPASVSVNYRKLTNRSADTCTNSTATVRKGDRGEAVSDAQCLLIRKGYTSVGAIDGIFGDRTDAAVRAFQRSRGLVADGIVGPRTWAALKA